MTKGCLNPRSSFSLFLLVPLPLQAICKEATTNPGASRGTIMFMCFYSTFTVLRVREGLIFPMPCFGYLKRSMATKQLRYYGADTFARNVSEKIKLLVLYAFGYRNDF